jgi:hypothetical protein
MTIVVFKITILKTPKFMHHRFITDQTEIDEIIKKRTQQSTQAAKMRAAKMSKSNPMGTTVAKSSPTEGKSFRDILAEQIDE